MLYKQLIVPLDHNLSSETLSSDGAVVVDICPTPNADESKNAFDTLAESLADGWEVVSCVPITASKSIIKTDGNHSYLTYTYYLHYFLVKH